MMFKYSIPILISLATVKSVLESGEFDLVVQEYIICKGPKRINCLDGTVKILNNTNVQFEYEIKQEVKAAKGKVVSTFNNQDLVRIQIKDVCKNVFILPLIKNFFQMAKSCKFSKGVFNLTITQFTVCKGPKQHDCAIANANISNYYTLLYEISVLRNVSPKKGKITAMSNGKEFLRLQIKKTCEHLFIRPLIGALLNVTNDCVVQKGHYKITIDIQEIAKSYFGGKFLFGNWTFKSLFYNDDCNFSCSVIQVVIFPLN